MAQEMNPSDVPGRLLNDQGCGMISRRKVLRILGVAAAGSLLMLAVGFAVFQRLSPRHVHYL